jgi:excisionase family DNA binding protein
VEDEQEEPMLTLHEAAAILGIGAEQVRRYARSGVLPYSRVRGTSGRYLIRQSAVQEFAAHRAASSAAPLLDRLDAIERRLDALESAHADPSVAGAVLAELADLRAENAVLKDSETRLALAADAEHTAADALAAALERVQAAERARANAAGEYAAALRGYRMPGHPGRS